MENKKTKDIYSNEYSIPFSSYRNDYYAFYFKSY